MSIRWLSILIILLVTAAQGDELPPIPLPPPPPIEPFDKADDPTGQSLEAVLAFLPATIASYGDKTLAKVTLCGKMGVGLKIELQRGRTFTQDELRDKVRKLADNWLYQRFLQDSATAAGIEAKDEDIQQVMNRAAAEYGGIKNFTQMLEAQGMPFEVWKANIARKLIADNWVRQLSSELTVSEEKVIDFYGKNQQEFTWDGARVRASHILLRLSPVASPEDKAAAREKLSKVLSQARAGTPFEELARTHSHCPSANRGGDLNFFRQGQMVPPFEQAAFAMSPGDVSDVIETKFGFHIIKVTDRAPVGLQPLSRVQDEIIEKIRGQFLIPNELERRSQVWREAHKAKIHI